MPYFNDMAILAFSISDNLAETPEGFLLCKNVRIARTGVQEYAGRELGLHDQSNEIVKVYRLPEEVFSQDALRSFEGKPVTCPHPPGGVTPDNASVYIKGHVQNIRQDGKYMLGDLLINDSLLIKMVRDKQVREVSCGYSCDYTPYKDGYKQTGITGNHVAVVEKGRAGSRVAITDSVNRGVKSKMKLTKKQAQAKLLAAFAKDASDEEFAEMMDIMSDSEPTHNKSGLRSLFAKLFDAKANDEEGEKEDKGDDEGEGKKTDDAITAQLAAMQKTLDALVAGKAKAKPQTTAADTDFVDSLFASDDDDDEDKEDKDVADEDTEKEKKETADAAVKGMLDALKPHLAALPAKQQQLAKDAIRKQLGKPASSGEYGKIQKVVQQATKDAEGAAPVDYRALAEGIMAKNNPHVQKQMTAAEFLKK